MKTKRPLIIGVAGGSGSGKTTFARRLTQRLGEDKCSLFYQDNYYIDQSEKLKHHPDLVNFDHPHSLDFNLMARHLEILKSGETIQIPKYDFKTHKRMTQTQEIKPTPTVVVDGILLFSQKRLLELFDFKIYVRCPEKLRFARRLKRDVLERGRTEDDVISQYTKQVLPMHNKFVSPSKKEASDIIDVENFDEKMDFWCQELTTLIDPIKSRSLGVLDATL